MSTKPSQPLRQTGPDYSESAIKRELEYLHKVLNDRLVLATQEDLETGYAAGDLGTAAAIATALNVTNTAINRILAKIRLD
jgi:hypothetical protein